jgi:hypothetical protein
MYVEDDVDVAAVAADVGLLLEGGAHHRVCAPAHGCESRPVVEDQVAVASGEIAEGAAQAVLVAVARYGEVRVAEVVDDLAAGIAAPDADVGELGQHHHVVALPWIRELDGQAACLGVGAETPAVAGMVAVGAHGHVPDAWRASHAAARLRYRRS